MKRRMKPNFIKERIQRSPLGLFLLLSVLFFHLPHASADSTYPNRPINMIVPFAPGGGNDLASKSITERITEFLGQPIISVYKPGGGGSLGAAFAAKAKPDGYTILSGDMSSLVIGPIVKQLDYKLEDLIPVGMYGKIPIMLAVKADARWKTLKEFVTEAKQNPGKLQVSSFGKLSTADFVIELFSKHAGIKITHVPFKASGEALTAVLGGHADGAVVTGTGGLLEAGSIRILAVSEEKRLEGLPDVATFQEFGYRVLLSGRYSLCFPKGTPQECIDKLWEAQKKVFERYPKEIRERLRKVDLWPEFLNPEETARKFKEEREKIIKIAEELGVRAK